jgi:hypothetical protein
MVRRPAQRTLQFFQLSATNYQLPTTNYKLPPNMPLAAEKRLCFAAFDVLKTHPLYVILSLIMNICSVLTHAHPPQAEAALG